MDDLLKAINARRVVIGVENIAGKILKACDVCDQEFSLAGLISHKQVHKECLPNSKRESEIDNTVTNIPVYVHENQSFYKCSLCRQVFTKESLLRIHQIRRHSLTLAAYLDKDILPEIQKKYLVGCTDNTSFRRSHCHSHNKATDHKKRFKCRYCDKLFLLHSQCKSHENSHVLEPVQPSNKLNSSSDSNPIPDGCDTNLSVLEISPDTNGLHAVTVDSSEVNSIAAASIPPLAPKMMPEYGSTTMEVEPSNHAVMGLPKASYGTLQMPKLVAVASLRQQHDMNEFSFPGEMKTTQVISSFATYIPVKYEIAEPTLDLSENNSVKEVQVPSNDYSSAMLTNGNGTPNDCDEKMYKCLVCAESYSESNIFAHAKSHLKKGQKECDLCDYKSMASADLRDHLLPKHYNLKPYKCLLCPNVYAWQSGWKKHMTTHNTEKTFKCDQCPLKFHTQRDRSRHELTHSVAGSHSNWKKKKVVKIVKVTKSMPSDISQNPNPIEHGHPIPHHDFTRQEASNLNTHHHHPTTTNYEYNAQEDQNAYPSAAATYNVDAFHHQQMQNYYGVNSQNYNNENNEYSSSQTQLLPGVSDHSWVQAEQTSTYPSYTNQPQQAQAPEPLVQHNHNNWNAEQVLDGNYHVDQNHFNGNDKQLGQTDEQYPAPPPPSSGDADDLRETEICQTCNKEIPIGELLAHIQSHILPGHKACTICKYKCNNKLYLTEHYNIHYALKPYSCDICKRKFAMRGYLRSHLQHVHGNESSRRHQCRYCNKRFVRSCHLRTHEIIHEGQELPPVEPTVADSDSNSNSNKSFRTPLTPERKLSVATSSPSSSYGDGNFSRSNTSSPQTTTTSSSSTPVRSIKMESQWSGSGNDQTPTAPWPQYLNVGGYDQNNGWNCYSPLVRTDVNWTQALYDSPCQQLHPVQGYNTTPQKLEASTWSSSESSSGFYSASNYSNSTIPSSSVQDLWAELHFEELKWFPESSTAFTADGIPMITELAPLDGLSYTEMLNNATADLPMFPSAMAPVPVPEFETQDIREPLESASTLPVVNYEKRGNAAARNRNGRVNGALSSKVKRKLKLRVTKRASEAETDQLNFAGIPQFQESLDDDNEIEEDMDALKMCLICKIQVPKKDLLVHIRSHLTPGERTCEICKRTYCNAMTLREHVHVHYKLKPYKCSFCPQAYSTKYSRRTHEVFNHEQRKSLIVECPYADCGKPFAMRSELQKHIRAHAKKNGTSLPLQLEPNRGSITSKRTRKISGSSLKLEGLQEYSEIVENGLRNELINDAKRKSWEVRLEDIGRKITKQCQLCKEDILLADFIEHKSNHREPCHICQKSVLVTNMIVHGPTHVGEQTECEICGWGLSNEKVALWEHMNKHLKVKPISCLYCGERFPSRNTLQSHHLALHTKFR